MFTTNDQNQLKQKGISLDYINWQVAKFKNGVPFINLDRAATPGDGIIQINNPDYYIGIFNKADFKTLKFVPASGAASRMFKALHEQRAKLGEQVTEVSDLDKVFRQFINSINDFAFYEILNQYANKYGGVQYLIEKHNYKEIIDLVLDKDYLNYNNLPKGLIHFHKYDKYVRRAVEEHLVEGALYSKSKDNSVHLHFTVSTEHKELFEKLIQEKRKEYEDKYGVTYKVDFSIQKSSKDTMAVTPDNQPFREDDGSILFRPAGHGALIENLNELDADLVFVKNIDNVVTETRLKPTVKYKKVLAGLLIDMQKQIRGFLQQIENGEDNSKENAINFIRNILKIEIEEPVEISEVRSILNRPVRVCGVVKNIGEPGGGPFWVKDKKGYSTLQIVESSQIDIENSDQKKILQSSTHFNPVDLVCGMKDFKGHKFDLKVFVDEDTCFISSKSKDGKNLKALELPGLWNGAMAEWITFFVEVPLETFNPVKTVNDLLRKEHQ